MGTYLFYNANVLTIDPSRPRAEAVLVKGEGIEFVGSTREALNRAPRNCRRIDLGGQTLIPGFNDNHIHTLGMADYLAQPKLHGMKAEEIVEYLREYHRNVPPGTLLMGFGWDYPTCPHPHKSLLDRAFPHHPVALIQFSGHGAWLNSLALRRFRVGPRTPDPPGGVIVRDDGGEATGILRDKAVFPIHQRRFIKINFNRKIGRELLELALEEFGKVGLTSVQDNTWFPPAVGLFNRFQNLGKLTCRFSCWFLGIRPLMARIMELWPFDESWVRRGPWKYFLDGTFSTKTAWLMEPYAEEEANFGMGQMELKRLQALIERAARRHRQAAFHAIGDRAVHEFLNISEQLRPRYPWLGELRLRLEHAQLIHPDDIPRLRRLGVLIAAQPHALGTPDKDRSLLGRARAERAYPYRSLLEAGASLSFGSDMPGESSFAPLLGIHRAVNRPGPERLTPDQALTCYTLGSAYAEFQEEKKGSLTPGKWADLVVLSEDPLSVPPEKIKEIRVEMTMVGGRLVYSRDPVFLSPDEARIHRSQNPTPP